MQKRVGRLIGTCDRILNVVMRSYFVVRQNLNQAKTITEVLLYTEAISSKAERADISNILVGQ